MPLKLSNLTADTRRLTFTYAGEEVNVTYRPSRFTPAMATGGRAAADPATTDEDKVRNMVRDVVALVESWDVLADDGEPLPITEDVVSDLPFRFLNTIVQLVAEDSRPEAKGGRSNGG